MALSHQIKYITHSKSKVQCKFNRCLRNRKFIMCHFTLHLLLNSLTGKSFCSFSNHVLKDFQLNCINMRCKFYLCERLSFCCQIIFYFVKTVGEHIVFFTRISFLCYLALNNEIRLLERCFEEFYDVCIIAIKNYKINDIC